MSKFRGLSVSKHSPLAILISDVHYNLTTLTLADAAMKIAVDTANELDVPLVVAGDLHDTKANLRGECVKAMMDTLERCRYMPVVLVGNHCKLNEKSNDHSLEFLRELAWVINEPKDVDFDYDDAAHRIAHFIPYFSDITALKKHLKTLKPGTRIIMHQGLKESHSGEYFQDKTALTKEDLAGFRVISGHYHRRQTLVLPDHGTFDFIGNPYSLNFGEADDPPKGFQILYSDGSLEFIPTNLRKHIKLNYEINPSGLMHLETERPEINPGDQVWIKVYGPTDLLATITRRAMADISGVEFFKLDLVPTEIKTEEVEISQDLSQAEIFDGVIESLTNTAESRKIRLKELWKDLLVKE